MSDFIDSIFESVDILIDRKLEDLAYDVTITCRVVDNSDRKNGKYRVSDGSVTYIAYSENSEYKVGESVRVSIPNNDYTQKKFILGKYGEEETTIPITYVSSVDSVVNISGNLAAKEDLNTPNAEDISQKQFGIAANGPVKKKIIWNRGFTNGEFENLQIAGVYNTIILKADFKTLLANYNLVEGTYGLRIDLLIRPSVDSPGRIRKTAELSSKEMFGNPYNFVINSTQSKTFSFNTAGGIIEGIELSLFQNGDFRDRKQGYFITDNEDIFHILVSNIEVGIGSDITDIEDNIVKIYSPNSLSYNYNPHTEDTNLKKIGLLWYNKDINNKYLGFSDGYYDPEYDELDYLQKSTINSRLVAQMGRENIPEDETGLQIAADLEEIIRLSKKEINLFNQDVITMLRNYLDEIKSIYAKRENSDDIYALVDNALTDRTNEFIQYLDDVKSFYIKALGIVKEGKSNKNEEGFSLDKVNDYSLLGIEQRLRNIWSVVDTELKFIGNEIRKGYTGFIDIVDLYTVRFNRIYNSMEDIFKIFPKSRTQNNPNGLLSDNEVYNYLIHENTFPKYTEENFDEYSNKYCVYWYKYEKGYKASLKEETYQLMPENWRRLIFEDSNKNEIKNIGVPRYNNSIQENRDDDGKLLNPLIPIVDIEMISQYLPNDSMEEKYVAIVFYNHNIYKSEELIFTNSQTVPDNLLLDKSDGLVFDHIKNSYDSYQVYTETNYLYDASDENKLREVRCRYDGIVLKDNDVFPNAHIYWYIPTGSTMIFYDEEELKNRGFTVLSESNGSAYENGYICFYKKITEGYVRKVQLKEDSDEETEIDDRSFWYKISPYYDHNFVKNHIICKVIPSGEIDSVETKLFLTFGTMGASGTKYTLSITNITSQSAVQNDKSLLLKVNLRDANNDKVEGFSLNDTNITWPFRFQDSNILGHTASGDQITIGGKSCGIFELTYTYKSINLKQRRCVPWSAGDYYISGATSIIYNDLGTLNRNSIFDIPYKLYDAHTNEEVTGITWKIKYYTSSGAESDDDVDEKFMPTLTTAGILKPAPMYLTGIDNSCFPVVIAEKGEDNILWQQPIIILQNRYGIPMLNDWDGSLEIDNGNGTIMSTMIGAGKKDSFNAFSGVLMGDISGATTGNKSGIGLYGFHSGAQSFCFNVDGTAFLGKSGQGRISFDGTQGTIQSGNYQTDKLGMKIDLEAGSIDAYNFKLTSKYVTIDSSKSGYDTEDTYSYASSHFVVKGQPLYNNGNINYDANPITLMTVGSNGMYLQSANYSTSSKVGMKIDLARGSIDAYNFKLTSNYVTIDSTGNSTNYFVIKDKSSTPKTLMNVGTNSYYLQSSNYNSSTGAGTYIDLNNGYIYSKQFDMISDKLSMSNSASGGKYFSLGGDLTQGEGGLYFGSDNLLRLNAGDFKMSADGIFLSSTPESFKGFMGYKYATNLLMKVGNLFGIGSDGTLYSKDGEFEGTVTATAGTIGGCSIVEGTLYVPAAQIDGPLSANQIDVDSITIDMAQVNGTLSAERVSFGSLTTAEFMDDGSFRIYGGYKEQYFLINDRYIYMSGQRGSYGCTFMMGNCQNYHDITFSAHSGHFDGSWTTTSEIAITSDRNQKNSIEILDNRYDDFFSALQPIRFKYNNGTSNRYHTGFIAQDVCKALEDANLSTLEFSGYVKRKCSEDEYEYLLRYENFISLNTWQIQKLKNRISELENRIKVLEKEV